VCQDDAHARARVPRAGEEHRLDSTDGTSKQISQDHGVLRQPGAGVGAGWLGLGWWGWFLIAGVVGVFVLHPLDPVVDRWLHSRALGGDLRRELMALQQYGQFSVNVLVCLLIVLLDKSQRVRLLDYGVALALMSVATFGAKMLIGRPRPQFGDHETFLGPFGVYPILGDNGQKILVHAWDLGSPSHAQLWSMPSSHTAFAVGMSVMLASLYPAIRWVVVVLAGVVMLCRLLFDAHWLTDVVAGAAIAGAVCQPALAGRWGQRVFRKGRVVV